MRSRFPFIPDGATLQTGIGGIPNTIATALAEGPGSGYGIHSEMFTSGLMRLCQAGKVANDHKGIYDGYSVTTFAAGIPELYEWLDGNRRRPVSAGRNHQLPRGDQPQPADDHHQRSHGR